MKQDFKRVVEIAPSIKSNRYTWLSVEKNIETAKKLIDEDAILNTILK